VSRITSDSPVNSQKPTGRRAIRRVIPERVAFGVLPAVLFAVLPSSPWPIRNRAKAMREFSRVSDRSLGVLNCAMGL
jgi:hypothetical protein